jgi:hypothetical protein
VLRIYGFAPLPWEGQGWVSRGSKPLSLWEGDLFGCELTHPALRAPLPGGDDWRQLRLASGILVTEAALPIRRIRPVRRRRNRLSHHRLRRFHPDLAGCRPAHQEKRASRDWLTPQHRVSRAERWIVGRQLQAVRRWPYPKSWLHLLRRPGLWVSGFSGTAAPPSSPPPGLAPPQAARVVVRPRLRNRATAFEFMVGFTFAWVTVAIVFPKK